MPLRSERRFISYSQVKSGMMVQFLYKKQSGETESYVAIIIDPSKQKITENVNEVYMHAILLSDLTDYEIIKLAEELGEEVQLDLDNRRLPITYLQTDEAYNRYKSSNIKPKRIYRTFIVKNIKLIRQVLLGRNI